MPYHHTNEKDGKMLRIARGDGADMKHWEFAPAGADTAAPGVAEWSSGHAALPGTSAPLPDCSSRLPPLQRYGRAPVRKLGGRMRDLEPRSAAAAQAL